MNQELPIISNLEDLTAEMIEEMSNGRENDEDG